MRSLETQSLSLLHLLHTRMICYIISLTVSLYHGNAERHRRSKIPVLLGGMHSGTSQPASASTRTADPPSLAISILAPQQIYRSQTTKRSVKSDRSTCRVG